MWINVIEANGHIRRIPGWPNDYLSDTLVRCNSEQFIAFCGGGDPNRRVSSEEAVASSTFGPSCGHCQVAVSDPWFSYMKPKIHPIEFQVIESTSNIHFPTSRLACCIKLVPWMNEMIVRIVIDEEERRPASEEQRYNENPDYSYGGAATNTKMHNL